MSRSARIFLLAALMGSLLAIERPALASTEGQVVRTTQTSQWSPPSSDPTGLTYNAKSKRLLVSDSEIDEGTLWHGKNLFIAGKKGGLIAARSLKKATVEPEDIVWVGLSNALFVVDDDLDVVLRFKPGRDGKIGTSDDLVQKILDTRRFGSFDPHGVSWRNKGHMLIVADATTERVYKITRGRDLKFGTKDDVITKFGTSKFGFSHLEGVTFDKASGHLFLVDSRKSFVLETKMNGVLIRKITLPWCLVACNLSGLVFAPGSDGSPRRLYLTDRGKDNDAFPDPADYNDGKLYEIRFVKVP